MKSPELFLAEIHFPDYEDSPDALIQVSTRIDSLKEWIEERINGVSFAYHDGDLPYYWVPFTEHPSPGEAPAMIYRAVDCNNYKYSEFPWGYLSPLSLNTPIKV